MYTESIDNSKEYRHPMTREKMAQYIGEQFLDYHDQLLKNPNYFNDIGMNTFHISVPRNIKDSEPCYPRYGYWCYSLRLNDLNILKRQESKNGDIVLFFTQALSELEKEGLAK